MPAPTLFPSTVGPAITATTRPRPTRDAPLRSSPTRSTPLSPPANTATPAAALIGRDLTKSYAGVLVLDGIDLVASAGRRVGVIGENGAGKSTLLRLLAGVEQPDAGTVLRPADSAYLAQEPVLTGTISDVLTQALAPLHRAVAEVERLGALLADESIGRAGQCVADAYAEALEWAELHDAWDADRRAEQAAERLGLASISPERPVDELSGGERTRLALATMIAARPACVLLDEPTNHLDDAALELLEDFLVGLPGIVVAASHDRFFLDRVCTELLDLDPSALGTDGSAGRRYSYGRAGGFTAYLAGKADTRRRWEHQFAAEQAQIADLRAAAAIDTTWIAHNRGPRDNDKFIYSFKGGNVERALARRVHDAQRRLAVAERRQVARPPDPLAFRQPVGIAAAEDAESAVHLRELQVPGRVSVPRLDVPTGGRLLLTGPNGSGKSSLLAVLAGRLRPSTGVVRVTAIRIGLLDQDVTFDDPGLSARSTFARAVGPESADLLGTFGLLRPRELETPVGALSVGQRRRLALAILVCTAPDLVLLDEPTNHISLALAAELEEAIGTSAGTVIVATHDRWFRRRWDGPVYAA